MAVLPKARQSRRAVGGGGGSRSAASTPAPAGKSAQSGIRQQRVGGAGSSPRLHLTRKRTRTAARRDTTDGTTGKSSRSSGGGSGGACARAGSRLAESAAATAAAAGTRGRKRATQADTADVAKMMSVLKSDLSAALERTMAAVEKECGEFVTKALSGSTAGASRREEDHETAEVALREMDSRQAAIMAQCTGMLQTVKSSSSSLSAMVDRCNGALDKMQQAESRKLKSSLDRATGLLT